MTALPGEFAKRETPVTAIVRPEFEAEATLFQLRRAAAQDGVY